MERVEPSAEKLIVPKGTPPATGVWLAVAVNVSDPGRTSGEGVADNESVLGVCETSVSVVISVMMITPPQHRTFPGIIGTVRRS